MKMKMLCSFLLVVMLVYTCEGAGDILDKYDLLAIAQDDKRLQRTMICLDQPVPCDNLGDLKEQGTIVIKTNCGDCTPAQKAKYEKFVAYMQESRPLELAAVIKNALGNTPSE